MDSISACWRSLSGGPAAGDEIVRLIMMDEAGVGDPAHEPFLAVGAVIVHADRQAKHLEAALRQIRGKHCPDAPEDFVFHAMHIFSGESGNRYFSRDGGQWPKEKRWAILDDLVAIPKAYDLALVHGAVDRSDPSQIKEPNIRDLPPGKQVDVLHAIAFMICATKADWWMRHKARSNEVAMIVAEDHPTAKAALRRIHSFAMSPTNVTTLVPGWETYLPLRKIIDTVHYGTKRESALLQLADVWSFVVKRRLMATKRTLPEGDRFYAPMAFQHYQPELKSLKMPEQPV
jgi:hypothetical protein